MACLVDRTQFLADSKELIILCVILHILEKCPKWKMLRIDRGSHWNWFHEIWVNGLGVMAVQSQGMKTVQFWKSAFVDCFGKIELNQIFEHVKLRIWKSFLHEKCSLTCFLAAWKISVSRDHFKQGFRLSKFCLARKML